MPNIKYDQVNVGEVYICYLKWLGYIGLLHRQIEKNKIKIDISIVQQLERQGNVI